MNPSLVMLAAVLLGACAQTSTMVDSDDAEIEAWRTRSAPTPAGWPATTPVDAVEIRRYPVTRAAMVSQAPRADDESGPMFMQLFRHIDRNAIEMTAPVAMGYDSSAAEPRLVSMAFLYRSTELGAAGRDGPVEIRDLPSETFASVGVRGGYDRDNFLAGLARVEAWLAEHGDAWQRSGPPRYLGYNGPFVLPFMRYGEVQVPVVPREENPGCAP